MTSPSGRPLATARLERSLSKLALLTHLDTARHGHSVLHWCRRVSSCLVARLTRTRAHSYSTFSGTGSARAALVSSTGDIVAESTYATTTWRDDRDKDIFEQSSDQSASRRAAHPSPSPLPPHLSPCLPRKAHRPLYSPQSGTASPPHARTSSVTPRSTLPRSRASASTRRARSSSPSATRASRCRSPRARTTTLRSSATATLAPSSCGPTTAPPRRPS